MEAKKLRLCRDWRFRLFSSLKSDPAVSAPHYDDSDWEQVRVPHDWAAAGEFAAENDASELNVWADGILSPILHTGRTGGLPIVGRGVYRRRLFIGEEARGRSLALRFDGVMWEARVFVNGEPAAFCHFGYKSFEVEISSLVRYGEENLIAVEATVYPDCSRWYPGAGIYRNAYLIERAAAHIESDGVWLRQLEVTDTRASFLLSVEHTGGVGVGFCAVITDPLGECVATVNGDTQFDTLSALFTIEGVRLWEPGSPALYTAAVTLLDREGAPLDTVRVRFGARRIAFTPDGGFFLNGKPTKLRGVCNHHDLGSLGAALNVAALRRRLEQMQAMGANAIRTTHNPPSPELLELCDEMGLMVIDEFFDEWYTPKVKNGYAKYFRDYAATDARAIIRRDRNHPSVILWSIGNEILEQRDPEGWRAAAMLTDLCHATDPTRPTTAGFNAPTEAFQNHLTDFVDVVGCNYKPHLYAQFHREHPTTCLLGTETASCVSTRGVYHLPAAIDIPCEKREDLTLSAYELCAPSWAYYPEREFAAQEELPYVAGEFIWTGVDYLGEPTPYYSEWPARSSYFGAMDLAGLPKNRYYAYRAHWSGEAVLHVFPHWNWEGMEGQTVPVHAYSSAKTAELFINGRSYGKQTRGDRSGGKRGELERYRFLWENAVYEPGEVRVVAYDEAGRPTMEQSVLTAGAPHRIALTAEREQIAADGEDLVYVIASVTDAHGVLCPHSDARLFFTVEGAELLTTDNGDPRETESFARADKRCLAGRVVACLRSIEGRPGPLTLTAEAEGLEGAALTLRAE